MRFTGVKFEETILAWDEGARWAFRVDSAQTPVFDAFVEDYHFEPLQTFSRTLPRFAALGPAEFDGAVWPVFDDLADLVARGFAALERGEPAYERLRAIVRGPAPDASGGVRHVASDRHAAYLHRESLSGLIRDLRRRLGWPERLVASSAVQTVMTAPEIGSLAWGAIADGRLSRRERRELRRRTLTGIAQFAASRLRTSARRGRHCANAPLAVVRRFP